MLISILKEILIDVYRVLDGRLNRDLSRIVEDEQYGPLDQHNSNVKHVDEHLLQFVVDKLLELVLGHSNVVHSIRFSIIASEPVLNELGVWYMVGVETFAERIANAEQMVGDVEHLEVRIRLLKEKSW